VSGILGNSGISDAAISEDAIRDAASQYAEAWARV
jgi:hypothetical protein